MNRSFLSIAVAEIFATSVSGADTNWINGSGSWHSPTKWTAGVPTASSNAVFNLFGSTSSVTLTETGEVLSGRLIHQRGKVSLQQCVCGFALGGCADWRDRDDDIEWSHPAVGKER